MTRVFLGPWFHWVVVAVLAGLGWWSGLLRLHVTSFNLFIGLLVAVSVGTLVWVLATSSPGDRVTREAIREDDGDA
ncbi:MAG: hypothetical protein AAF334_11400 [Pseudomonadota bacterium]